MDGVSKPRWLDRAVMVIPCFTLCTSEEMFRAELKRMKVRDIPSFLSSDSANATTHWLDCGGRDCYVVCIKPNSDVSGIQVAALLVHEAVHVWQFYCDSIGERRPSDEFEAYSIQTISQRLMEEYERQQRPA